MRKTVCRICLRCDFERTEHIDERLADFHDELCDYDVLQNSWMKFCSICEYLLKKFYNFKQKCRRAHNILKDSKRKKNGFENLHLLMPSPIRFSAATDRQQVYNLIPSEENGLQCYLLLKNDNGKTVKEDINKLKTEIKQKQVATSCIQEDTSPTFSKQRKELPKPSLQDNRLRTLSIQGNEEVLNEHLVANDCYETEYLDSDFESEISDCDIIQISDNGDGKKQMVKINNSKKNLIEPNTVLKSKCDKRYMETKMTQAEAKTYEKKLQKWKMEFRDKACWLIQQGKVDLGDNIAITTEMFVKMFDKCDESRLKLYGVYKEGPLEPSRLRKFIVYLRRRHSAQYESVFRVQPLNTRARKMAEFAARPLSADFLNAPYKCQICYRGFQLQTLLDYHNKWHDPSRPLACDICGMRFLCLKNLKSHHRTGHEAVYRCKLCNIVTYNFSAMLNHYHSHKGVQYKCDVCLSEYNSRSSRNTHRLTHAAHACPRCARCFVSEKGVRHHIMRKHPEAAATKSSESVSCDKCGATFESRDTLQIHTRQRHEGKCFIYKCRYKSCMEQFPSVESLREHIVGAGHVRWVAKSRQQAEDGDARWKGVWFPPRVGQLRVVKGGQEKVTGPDKPYRTCPICNMQVPNTAPLSLYSHHIALHPDLPYTTAVEHGFLCELCGKSFRVGADYYDHLNTHSGAKPYQCSECSASFHMKRSLLVHRTRHRPPRYKCKDCGKMFLTQSNLYVHRLSHIGDRRFKCGICFKGFLHRAAVKEHIDGVHKHIRRIKKSKKILSQAED